MAEHKPQPKLVFADDDGNIYDHPELEMLVRRGDRLEPPRPDEIIPLPPESELFLLPGRDALGFDPESGEIERLEDRAVAAFVCPGHTLSATAAYAANPGAPVLPLFAYGAVGFSGDRFVVAAARVDEDRRQVFTGISKDRIVKGARALRTKYPKNHLIEHLCGCALTSCCPAARNLALGRFEAPLPTSRACNARCVGCLSLQDPSSGFPSTQSRIAFRPTAQEIVEVMAEHGRREPRPVFSFGQGCEGEPLTEIRVIAEAVARFRKNGGRGTVNINTNASLPDAVEAFAAAGGTSIRASLSSADAALYEAYYRPQGYSFADVGRSLARARASGLFISLNFLFFPGVSDTEAELAALTDLITEHRVDFVQLRNLNLDPELYLAVAKKSGALANPARHASMGLKNFRKRLRKACPWLRFGYFNPVVEAPPASA
ncbi:radical SAM protein [Solidesulfovibrio sp.]|uniref:radical SAM protein n=1 Tax=Solidesulfovibrio sp. TaxID=2910990 RepID=UPI00260739E1|nr:radical SAM protein [Solidesulfovibrio sp.]